MKYSEDKIKELIAQVLSDLELKYYEDKAFGVRIAEPRYSDKKYGIKKPWICTVQTHDWQWDSEDGAYIFSIDDESPNTIIFQDASGGQVPNSFIKKDESGKYYREYILR